MAGGCGPGRAAAGAGLVGALPERAGFPGDHPQFQGTLPFAAGPLAERLAGHDTVLVVGAPVFRYYPHVAGPHLPAGSRLLHVTDDPEEAAQAAVGDSVLGDPALACAALAELLPTADRPLPPPVPAPPVPDAGVPLSPKALFAALAREWPPDGVLVAETPSNVGLLRRYLPARRPASFFTGASGGLGFGLPAAVGIALGERHTGRCRPVLAVIGDGSFHYSVQALWTAARHRLPVVFVVPMNGQYAILKAFARHEGTPGVPGLDLPGLDILAIAQGYGCAAAVADSTDAVTEAVRTGLARTSGPTVLAVPITPEAPDIL
ncbi:thiamine pyrophosphate-dependent enzyme [Micromonospora zhanjiangensis]